VVVARGARADEPRAIRFRPARAASLLGMPAAKAESTRRLRALGAACSGDGAVLVVAPPSHRGDLQIEEDLVEEIARLGGYAIIPTTVPSAPVQAGADSPSRILSRRIRTLLAAEGLTEMVTLAFVDPATNAAVPGYVVSARMPVAIRNPLSAELSELRRSPLAALAGLANVSHGRRS
jgi:phenylalanyl-tRNA synthetase beta chain